MSIQKQIAVALFYNLEGEILLQDRRTRSKWGEEYGFFGGKVEDGETPDLAIKRELKEELELDNPVLTFFKVYPYRNPSLDIMVEMNIYLSPMPDLTKITCHEGKAEVRKFKESLHLKMIPGLDILEIYNFLKANHLTK